MLMQAVLHTFNKPEGICNNYVNIAAEVAASMDCPGWHNASLSPPPPPHLFGHCLVQSTVVHCCCDAAPPHGVGAEGGGVGVYPCFHHGLLELAQRVLVGGRLVQCSVSFCRGVEDWEKEPLSGVASRIC